MSGKKEIPGSHGIELQEPTLGDNSAITLTDASNIHWDEQKHFGSNKAVSRQEGVPVLEAVGQPIQQKWNYPRSNVWKIFVTFLSLFIMVVQPLPQQILLTSLILSCLLGC